jgi:hypothetical protein
LNRLSKCCGKPHCGFDKPKKAFTAMMAIPGDPSDWAPGMEQNERLNKCDAKDCAFAATLAFLFGTHARVGADSPIRKLTSELAHRVCELIRPPEPRTYAAAGG